MSDEWNKEKWNEFKILQGNNFSSQVTQLPISTNKRRKKKCKWGTITRTCWLSRGCTITHFPCTEIWKEQKRRNGKNILRASIVDSVNKKCQLRWRVRGVVCQGGGWSVQNVDRDRKWPGNWTQNTNEPVSKRWHTNSAEVSSLTLNDSDWSSGKANTYCVKPKC